MLEALRDAIQDLLFSTSHPDLENPVEAAGRCEEQIIAAHKQHPALVTEADVHLLFQHVDAVRCRGPRLRGAHDSLANLKAIQDRLGVQQMLSQATPQPITTSQAAKLAGIGVPAFNNAKTRAAKAGDPAPAQIAKGEFDYRDLRPWMMRQWPAKGLLVCTLWYHLACFRHG